MNRLTSLLDFMQTWTLQGKIKRMASPANFFLKKLSPPLPPVFSSCNKIAARGFFHRMQSKYLVWPQSVRRLHGRQTNKSCLGRLLEGRNKSECLLQAPPPALLTRHRPGPRERKTLCPETLASELLGCLTTDAHWVEEYPVLALLQK